MDQHPAEGHRPATVPRPATDRHLEVDRRRRLGLRPGADRRPAADRLLEQHRCSATVHCPAGRCRRLPRCRWDWPPEAGRCPAGSPPATDHFLADWLLGADPLCLAAAVESARGPAAAPPLARTQPQCRAVQTRPLHSALLMQTYAFRPSIPAGSIGSTPVRTSPIDLAPTEKSGFPPKSAVKIPKSPLDSKKDSRAPGSQMYQ